MSWKDDPATPKQIAYIRRLLDRLGVVSWEPPENFTKRQAGQRIAMCQRELKHLESVMQEAEVSSPQDNQTDMFREEETDDDLPF